MTSQKYAYADDLALLYATRDWKAVEDTLSQGMTTLSAYLQTWSLKFNNTKMATAAFHLNNREAKRELSDLSTLADPLQHQDMTQMVCSYSHHM